MQIMQEDEPFLKFTLMCGTNAAGNVKWNQKAKILAMQADADTDSDVEGMDDDETKEEVLSP